MSKEWQLANWPSVVLLVNSYNIQIISIREAGIWLLHILVSSEWSMSMVCCKLDNGMDVSLTVVACGVSVTYWRWHLDFLNSFQGSAWWMLEDSHSCWLPRALARSSTSHRWQFKGTGSAAYFWCTPCVAHPHPQIWVSSTLLKCKQRTSILHLRTWNDLSWMT